jgi:beta-glucosidase
MLTHTLFFVATFFYAPSRAQWTCPQTSHIPATFRGYFTAGATSVTLTASAVLVTRANDAVADARCIIRAFQSPNNAALLFITYGNVENAANDTDTGCATIDIAQQSAVAWAESLTIAPCPLPPSATSPYGGWSSPAPPDAPCPRKKSQVPQSLQGTGALPDASGNSPDGLLAVSPSAWSIVTAGSFASPGCVASVADAGAGVTALTLSARADGRTEACVWARASADGTSLEYKNGAGEACPLNFTDATIIPFDFAQRSAAAAPLPSQPVVAAVAFPWQDPSQPVAARVANLISLLTLEEKASLLNFQSPAIPRLALPAFSFETECQRGVRAPAVPVVPFPSGAAQTATFNSTLAFSIGAATAVQARANYNVLAAANKTGGTTCYGPTMNLVRHPTWGRVNEMLGGEDPHLTGALASAFARGLQSLRAPSAAPGEELWAISTVAKHLAVYSGPEGMYGDRSDEMPGMVDARYNSTSTLSEREYREYYLPAWRTVVVDGGATGFMSSYQALNLTDLTPATAARMAELGYAPNTPIPDTANTILLTDEVRGQWRAPGYVISDSGAVACTATCRQSKNGGMRGHQFAANASDAAVRALVAGVDLEISCCGIPFTFPTLPDSVRAGILSESLLDRALGRTLPWRFSTGALNPPSADPWAALGAADMATPGMRDLAADAARQGVTLLKNIGGTLPLSPAALAGRFVAVVGPNADDPLAMMGSYGYIPIDGSIVTPFAGLADALPGSTVSLLADPLCSNVVNCSAYSPSVVASAAAADVIVLVLGASAAINSYTCAANESYNEKEECDRHDAALPGAQLPLLQAIAALGRPLVLILASGGALEVDWAAASPDVHAIIHAPYLGVAAGTALADVLIGAQSPSGRLAASWYTSAGLAAIGGIQEYRMRADGVYPGRTYLWTDPALVQFPFGFGLSFANFSYTVAASTATAAPCDNVTITVTVMNASPFDADEVVQAYASLPDASFVAPARALVGFARIRVPALGLARVALQVTPRARSILREGDLVRVVEPGRVLLWVGGCSAPALAPGAAADFTVVGAAVSVDSCEA